MIILFWLAMAIVCAVIAPSRGRSAVGWFFIGLLLSFLGIILLFVLPDLKAQEAERRSAEAKIRQLRAEIRRAK